MKIIKKKNNKKILNAEKKEYSPNKIIDNNQYSQYFKILIIDTLLVKLKITNNIMKFLNYILSL